MRIDSPQVSNLTFQEGAAVADSSFTGSFSGSFTGVGNFTGLTADNVEYANVLNKPTLVSGSAQVVTLVEAGTDSNTFTDADHTKLNGIEASADVTDTENVTAAGALMDTEVTNLADVKAFDPADYATAAQGTTADSAQQPPSEGAFVDGDKTKLDGIEASADVTDTANVTAAGALMDSEVDADIKTLSLPANTTISAFGKTLVDDADAAAARTTLGVDAAGTDNSTDVTLGGSLDYISIDGQVITRNAIDLSTDVTGTLPVGNMAATALTTIQTAANEIAHLALTAQEGDVVVRSDENKTYMHNGGTAGAMSDYTLLATPTDAVTSVNGNTGVVTVTENVTTNLSTTANGTSLVINSSDGTNASIPAATTSAWGAMTDEDKTKLDGIEASADVTDATNVQAAGALMDSEVDADIKTLSLPANTTISAFGKTLVDDADAATARTTLGVDAAGTVNYSHPTHPGDDFSVDTGALTGATVVSDIDINITTDTLGHVTDANGSVATRTLTLANLGYTGATDANNYVHPTFAGDDISVDTGALSGATVISDLDFNITTDTNGHVTDANGTVSTRTLTAANLSLGTSNDVQFDSFGVGTAASGTTGEIRATGDITAYYSSDERLKENFAPLTGALDKVKAIGGYEFDWKDGIEDIVSKKGHDIGVKAQELQAQYPDLVHERDNGYLAVDYIKLNAVLIEAVKELAAKVEELSK